MAEWIELEQIDPLPDPARDAAMIAHQVHNGLYSNKLSLADFLPVAPESKPRVMSPSAMKATVDAILRGFRPHGP